MKQPISLATGLISQLSTTRRSGTSPHTLYELAAVAPAGTTRIRVRLNVTAGASGRALFDEIALRQ